jgi:hypothetical protein
VLRRSNEKRGPELFQQLLIRRHIRARLTALCAAVVTMSPTGSWAHVKWFVDYNLQAPPRTALSVVSSAYFVGFCLAIGPLMFAIAFMDRYLTQRECFLHKRATRLTERTSPYFPLVLQAGVSAFFLAVFVYGCLGKSIILTPELHTHEAWICWVQLALAVLVLSQRTMALAGLGIVFLYFFAVMEYGLFHMLDYPIFLGVAAFLVIESMYGEPRRGLAYAVLRVSAGVTLLWASIEKFAFPEWSFLLMAQHPGMALGFNPEFYMVAAGFVEFCAAYLLITGFLSARLAALALLILFVVAILPFGRIDAVGHSVIIIVLLLLTLSHNPMGARLDVRHGIAATATVHAGAFFMTLLLFISLYYAGYHLSYGTPQHL